MEHVFKVERTLVDRPGMYIVYGPHSELYPGDKVLIEWDDESRAEATVMTRFNGGALVRTF